MNGSPRDRLKTRNEKGLLVAARPTKACLFCLTIERESSAVTHLPFFETMSKANSSPSSRSSTPATRTPHYARRATQLSRGLQDIYDVGVGTRKALREAILDVINEALLLLDEPDDFQELTDGTSLGKKHSSRGGRGSSS